MRLVNLEKNYFVQLDLKLNDNNAGYLIKLLIKS